MMRISKKKSCTRLRDLICPQSLQRRCVRDRLVKRNCGFRIANCGFYHTLGSVPHFVWFMIGLMQKSEKNVKMRWPRFLDHWPVKISDGCRGLVGCYRGTAFRSISFGGWSPIFVSVAQGPAGLGA
jgi:hypothetical protein